MTTLQDIKALYNSATPRPSWHKNAVDRDISIGSRDFHITTTNDPNPLLIVSDPNGKLLVLARGIDVALAKLERVINRGKRRRK